MKSLPQLIRYFFVGSLSAVVEWVSFFLCDKAGFFYAISTIISFLIATWVNFLLGRTLAFSKESINLSKEVLFIYFVSLIGLGINLAMMFLLVSVLGWTPFIAKLCSTWVAFFWNFFSRKYFVYKQ